MPEAPRPGLDGYETNDCSGTEVHGRLVTATNCRAVSVGDRKPEMSELLGSRADTGIIDSWPDGDLHYRR
jgi:hypothetical protein